MKASYQAAFRFVKSKMMSEQYDTFRIKSNDDELLAVLRFVEKLLPDRVLIVCEQSKTPRLQYVSENCKKVLGYRADEILHMPLPEFMELIHPEDSNGVQQCLSFITELEPYDPLRFRFEIHYRIKMKDGDYIHVSNEAMTLMNHDTYIHISSFRNVSAEEKFHQVKLNIYQCIQGVFRKTDTYNPRQNTSTFTPRQNDILALISKGFSNQEIADRLSLSINTVKNHKSLLFKKINVKNSLDLVRNAGSFV